MRQFFYQDAETIVIEYMTDLVNNSATRTHRVRNWRSRGKVPDEHIIRIMERAEKSGGLLAVSEVRAAVNAFVFG